MSDVFRMSVFGRITDGPNTTFLPDTLKEILEEKNIESELITQIMNTINSQSNASYCDGYKDGRECHGRT